MLIKAKVVLLDFIYLKRRSKRYENIIAQIQIETLTVKAESLVERAQPDFYSTLKFKQAAEDDA